MNNIFRYFLILIVLFLLASCKEKITYSGKILNNKKVNYNDIKNRKELENIFGKPNFIDPIEKKFYYFSEQTNIKNFFDEKIENRTVLVFMFDENEKIKSISQFDLNDEKKINNINDKTPNELIERGLIEKIFGGVGKSVTPESNQ